MGDTTAWLVVTKESFTVLFDQLWTSQMLTIYFFFAKVWSRAWKKIFHCQQDGSIILRTKLTKWWWPFQTVENKCHIICQALWCVSLVNCRVLKDFHSLNHLEWIRGFDSFNFNLIYLIRLRIMNACTKIFPSQNRVVKSSIPDSESIFKIPKEKIIQYSDADVQW